MPLEKAVTIVFSLAVRSPQVLTSDITNSEPQHHDSHVRHTKLSNILTSISHIYIIVVHAQVQNQAYNTANLQKRC
jgi:hypothetical protein